MNNEHLTNFVIESNLIEGIVSDEETLKKEVSATKLFLSLPFIELGDLIRLVAVYQPDARLRTEDGDNVMVGNYYPPSGGVAIGYKLMDLLHMCSAAPTNDAWGVHITYEKLHPFTDGNGRSGRALWAWIYKDLSLGFLHRFYYQTLELVNLTKEEKE